MSWQTLCAECSAKIHAATAHDPGQGEADTNRRFEAAAVDDSEQALCAPDAVVKAVREWQSAKRVYVNGLKHGALGATYAEIRDEGSAHAAMMRALEHAHIRPESAIRADERERIARGIEADDDRTRRRDRGDG